MKILRVASDLYPDVVGGVGLHVHEMSKMQAEMGHDVTVFTQMSTSQPKREKKDGYKVKRFKPNLKIFGNSITLSMFKELYNLFDDYDIVHAHSHLYFSTNLCAFIKKFKKTPLIITNHGLESQTPPLWVSNIYNKTLGKWTFNNSDVVICYSVKEKEKLEQLGVKNKIQIIHNGINVELFKPLEDVKKKNQILWVGRYTPGKGVKYLIEAFSLLKKKHNDLKLKLVGDGPLKEDIKKLARERGIIDSVIFTDFIEYNKMPLIYNESKITVLPSLTEGIPRTILESLSCETPVISTELPQIKSIMNDCGFCVPRRSANRLSICMDYLLSKGENRTKLGDRGRKKILTNYSWNETVRMTNNLYNNLLTNSFTY